MRKFIFKHLINLNKTLVNLKKTGVTIFIKKERFCMLNIIIIGFVYDISDRYSKEKKITKIIN